MNNVFRWLNYVIDLRQRKKVKHLMKDIIAIVYFAKIANADDWMHIYYFALAHEKFLRKYLELPNGIPSHDTIQRVFAIVSPEFLEKFQKRWNELLNSNQGEKIRKILSIDGKTQRGNKRGGQEPNHIVSCVDEDGFSLSQKLVNDKSNEITAIPELLDDLNVKGTIITTDAMGCQKEIVAKIVGKKADYCLALKGNQGSLHEDVKLYFSDPSLLESCAYSRTVEKARSSIEIREYWQTEDISWLFQKKDWPKLKSIIMTRNTIKKGDKTTTETRYFISSLKVSTDKNGKKTADESARAIRKHCPLVCFANWPVVFPVQTTGVDGKSIGHVRMVESYHHHLDVTFKEDANQTADKVSAYNLNIISKLALNTLKLLDVGLKNVSIRAKRYITSLNPEKYIEMLLAL